MSPEGLEYKGIVTCVCEEDLNCSSSGLYTEYMHIFHTKSFSGNLIECNEGDLQWVPIEKMNDLPHWKGDEIFLDFLKTDMNFYSLKLEYRKGQLQRTFLNGKPYNHFK